MPCVGVGMNGSPGMNATPRSISNNTAAHDGRVRQLVLTKAGAQLEAQLTGTQVKQLQAAFDQAGPKAQAGWLAVMGVLSNQAES